MNFDYNELILNPLFRGIPAQTLASAPFLSHCTYSEFPKASVIAQEGDTCIGISLVLQGTVHIQHYSSSGEILTIKILELGDSFGEALLYHPNPKYLYTLYTKTRCQILFIPFTQVTTLLQTSQQFNQNFIQLLSGRISSLNHKLTLMHQKDLRSRILYYLTDEARLANSSTFRLRHNKTEIAELVGATRPSVSREFHHMCTTGLLSMEHNLITLHYQNDSVMSLSHCHSSYATVQ